MSVLVEDREPLSDHQRSSRAALGTVEVSHANAEEVQWRRDRWSAYLSCRPHAEAPLSTRMAPVLLDLVLADNGERLPAAPGSLYPAGFRHQVLGHTGWPATAMWFDPSARDAATSRRLAVLRTALDPASSVATSTLVSAAALLNVSTMYRVTVGALAERSSRLGNPALLYEVARAAYSLEADPARAVRPFELLAESADARPAVRLSAVTRLIAHYCRRDRSVEKCGVWADVALRMIDEHRSETFEIQIAISRIYRALALFALRRRDAAGVAEMIRATQAIASELVAGAFGEAEYLAAAMDERLVLEAALKAFVGSRGRSTVIDPAAAVDRILTLDPCDPYTQLIAGDALWLLGQDERAAERFGIGGSMGSLPGVLCAHRAAVVLDSLGRGAEAAHWRARVAELDAADADVH